MRLELNGLYHQKANIKQVICLQQEESIPILPKNVEYLHKPVYYGKEPETQLEKPSGTRASTHFAIWILEDTFSTESCVKDSFVMTQYRRSALKPMYKAWYSEFVEQPRPLGVQRIQSILKGGSNRSKSSNDPAVKPVSYGQSPKRARQRTVWTGFSGLSTLEMGKLSNWFDIWNV